MKDSRLADYHLEIKTLQVADYKNAVANGFESRASWYNYIISQNTDEIAEAIIDISNRYNVSLQRVASDFDPSMIMRVGKIINNKSNTKTK